MGKRKQNYYSPKKRKRVANVNLSKARDVRKRKSDECRAQTEWRAMRVNQLRKMRCGRVLSLMLYVLLFLQILNCESAEGITRYEATSKIASYSNMSSGRLFTKLTHYMKTGNFLVPLYILTLLYMIIFRLQAEKSLLSR